MRPKTVVLAAVVVLFLYWVVQAPVSAATTIHSLFDWSIDLLTMVADRMVQFLDALL
jgi:hypothetical protein